MKKFKWIIIALNLVILIVLFNKSLLEKEKILSDGKLVLLELAPVDPRSLMQEDYMQLNYEISQNFNDSAPKIGFCVVKIEVNGIAKKVRIQEDKTPLNENEFLIKCASNNFSTNIGAESFFFQEGQGEKYAAAKFGGIKIDNDGNSILIGLYDKELKKIE